MFSLLFLYLHLKMYPLTAVRSSIMLALKRLKSSLRPCSEFWDMLGREVFTGWILDGNLWAAFKGADEMGQPSSVTLSVYDYTLWMMRTLNWETPLSPP